jgi:MoxR-like ATPase
MTTDPVAQLIADLGERHYLADRGLATVLTIALRLGKPLLLEGEAGVGKTELGKTLAEVLDTRLIRLQCYEGIDATHALYDWNYARQMLYIRTLEAAHVASPEAVTALFSQEFLVRRPLLDAIDHEDPRPPILLIDEIDRADDEFEAFLLELLSDFQVTIPELGTIRARVRPVVLLTSNRTRDLSEALKRRCLYHWVAHPSLEREVAILLERVPGIANGLAQQVAAFVASLRSLELTKAPGVAEAVDWAQALSSLGGDRLEPELVASTLGALLKYREDVEYVRDSELAELVNSSVGHAAGTGT